MHRIVVRYRVYWWAGVIMFALCFAAGLLPGQSLIRMTILGAVMLTIFGAAGSQQVVFSESGITSCFLWLSSENAWGDVIQAGTAKVADHADQGPHLLLTFTGGVPKTPSMGFRDWRSRNPNTCLYVPDSEELQALVCKCYGPLDFDRA